MLSCISELSIDMPVIDFHNCYKKIQEIYNITQDLIIAIVDRLDQSNPNTSYSIYHPISGEKLDAATICKNETILVKENHYIDKNDPDYDLKMSLIQQKINLFDSDDDICFYFNNSKKRDIALSDRLKYFYQNTNLCDNGCKEVSFDLEKQQSECDCKFNDIETEEKNNELIKDNEILDAVFGDALEFINNSNILILKCFKFIFGYITDSFGALFSLICLFIHIILTALFFTKEFEKIKIYIFNITEKYLFFLLKHKNNAPPKKRINNIKKSEKIIHEKLNINNKLSSFKESNIIIKENNSDSNSKTNNVLSVNKKKKNGSKTLIFSKKLKSKFSIVDKANKKFFEEYLETSFDILEYDDALVKYKRSFCEYFAENFKDRQDISNTFFAEDPIKTRIIKIILFIFFIVLNFVINALFITEEYISEIYHLDNIESFFEFVPRSISRFIKTTLVGEVIGYVSDFFFIEENKIKSLFKREKENI